MPRVYVRLDSENVYLQHIPPVAHYLPLVPLLSMQSTTVKINVRKITEEMSLIQQQLKPQALRLQHVGKSLQDTILVVNTRYSPVGKLVEVFCVTRVILCWPARDLFHCTKF